MSREIKEEKGANGFVSLQDIYDGYAKKATEKEDFEVDIIARHEVVFTKDFVLPNGKVAIAKGHKQLVSTVNKDWYDANGVIKIIGVDKNKEVEKTIDKK